MSFATICLSIAEIFIYLPYKIVMGEGVVIKYMKWIKKLLKNRKMLIIIGVVLIAAAAGIIIFLSRSVKTGGTASGQRTTTVKRGELNITLSGSGTVSPVNRKEMTAAIDGVVTESYLEEGKSFKEGDVLVKFNDSDVQLSVKKLENALNQKRLELADIDSNISNGAIHITAPFTGLITELDVKEGDEAEKDKALLTIVDDSLLQASVVFENASMSQFKGLSGVKVSIPDFMASLTGKIKLLTQDGSNVNAVITVDNPGALTSGISVWAEAGTSSGSAASTEGVLEYVNREVVKAQFSGTISNLSVMNGMKVTQGKTLMSITGETLPYSIESAQLELEQAQVELKLAQEKLEFYTIKAPFDGVAVTVANLDPGDSVKAGASIAVMMDTSQWTFDLSIDELDISKVETGQKVKVTADALEDETVEGTVTAVAPEGESTNGVTSYNVTVTIPGVENLKSGMNVDAIIQIYTKEDALLVPVEALQKRGDGYIVWVRKAGAKTGGQSISPESKDPAQGENQASGGNPAMPSGNLARASGKASDNNYYSGATPVPVKVGMHNETYAEITEGLSEGDTVILPALVSNSGSGTTSTENRGGAGFAVPGMGGGAPVGGMPAGGMSGGMSGRRSN